MLVRTTVSKKSENIEKESLEAHVEICGHRYAVLENKLAEIEKNIKDSRDQLLKIVGVIAAVISASASIIVVMLNNLH